MANFTIDNSTDEQDGNYGVGDLSLREAVTLANLTAAADTIGFSNAIAGDQIVLTQGELALVQDVTIDGDTNNDEKADVTISGGGTSRIFRVDGLDIDVAFKSLALVNGDAGINGGGAVLSTNADITFQNTTISSNSARSGGGIYALNGILQMVNSTVYGCAADSGPLSNGGGGIRLNGCYAVLTNTTIYGNAAGGSGGGISANNSSPLTLRNCTVTANRADADGDGTGNGGGILEAGITAIVNSVIADNFKGTGALEEDVSGFVDSATNSIFGTAVTIGFNSGSVQNIASANLGELLDNGGAVLTRSPLDGSLLIGFGYNALIPFDTFDIDNDGNTAEQLPLDARLLTRIVGAAVDVGAVEQKSNETIGGTAGDNTMLGGLGSDTLRASAGNDLMDGGAGIDTADYSAAAAGVTLNLALTTGQNVGAGLGTDTLLNIEWASGSAFADTITGNSAANLMKGGGGADSLIGAAGDDDLIGGAGLDTMNGGLGNDRFFVAEAGDTVIEAAGQGTDEVFTPLASYSLVPLANVERLAFNGAGNFAGTGNGLANRILGASGGDTLYGGGQNDQLQGEDGGDTWLGGDAGADTVYGGAGNDRIDGGADADTWLGGDAGADFITGGLGNDRVDGGADGDTWLGGDAGLDVIYGGLGNDRIDGGADSDTFLGGDAGIDTVTGGLGNDRIDGGVDNDFLYGGAGIDTITDGGGADTMDGGADNDFLYGGAGIDTIAGGDGADTINGGDDGDLLYGGAGIDTFIGGGGGDSINSGDSDDTAYGGDGDDVLQGLAGRDRLHGGLGGDTLYGGEEVGAGDIWLAGDAGFDFIFAGGGNDRLEGGADNDILYGGLGLDTSNGGSSADTFIYVSIAEGGAGEQIGDWQGGIDDLRIDASGFGGGLVAGALAANRLVIGTAATQAFGQFLYNTANGVLYWDSNGTGAGGLNFLVKLFTPTFGAPPASLATTDFEIVA